MVLQTYARRGNCSETYLRLIQSRKKSWRADHCSVGGPVVAAAGVEVEALSGKARLQGGQTCCYRSQMLKLQLLIKTRVQMKRSTPISTDLLIKVTECIPAWAAAGFMRRGVCTRRTGPPRPVLVPGPITRAPVWS